MAEFRGRCDTAAPFLRNANLLARRAPEGHRKAAPNDGSDAVLTGTDIIQPVMKSPSTHQAESTILSGQRGLGRARLRSGAWLARASGPSCKRACLQTQIPHLAHRVHRSGMFASR